MCVRCGARSNPSGCASLRGGAGVVEWCRREESNPGLSGFQFCVPRELLRRPSGVAVRASHVALVDLSRHRGDAACSHVGDADALLFGVAMIELKDDGIGLATVNARMCGQIRVNERRRYQSRSLSAFLNVFAPPPIRRVSRIVMSPLTWGTPRLPSVATPRVYAELA